MHLGSMRTRGTCRRVEHNKGFVRQAREQRRLRHLAAKEQRIQKRRINKDISFRFWVRKRQRVAQAIMNQLSKSFGLGIPKSIKL